MSATLPEEFIYLDFIGLESTNSSGTASKCIVISGTFLPTRRDPEGLLFHGRTLRFQQSVYWPGPLGRGL
jgi:hypothetical protein